MFRTLIVVILASLWLGCGNGEDLEEDPDNSPIVIETNADTVDPDLLPYACEDRVHDGDFIEGIHDVEQVRGARVIRGDVILGSQAALDQLGCLEDLGRDLLLLPAAKFCTYDDDEAREFMPDSSLRERILHWVDWRADFEEQMADEVPSLVGCAGALVQVDRLRNLNSVGGFVVVRDQAYLRDLEGLRDLEVSLGGIFVRSNAVLERTPIFSRLRIVDGFEVRGNAELSSIGELPRLAEIGSLHISRNPSLAKLTAGTFSALESADAIEIAENDQLTGLAGFEYLESVNELRVSSNRLLVQIDRFTRLESADTIAIGGNYQLHRLEGFDGLQTLGLLAVRGNARLETVDGFPRLTQLSQVAISQNHSLRAIAGFGALKHIGERDGSVGARRGLLHTAYLGYNPSLKTVGFDEVETVTGDLHIETNDALVDLSGFFPSLAAITGELHIEANDVLADLSGLSSLASVGDLTVLNSHALEDLSGLTSLERVEGNLLIQENDGLQAIGLGELRYAGGVHVEQNEALGSFEGLTSLEEIGPNGFVITSNPALQSLRGLERLTNIIAWLDIEQNPMLADLDGLMGVTRIGGEIKIIANSSLVDIDGLGSLDPATNSHANLTISQCRSLSSLEGLANMTTLRSLSISQARALLDLAGLRNLENVSTLSIDRVGSQTLAGLGSLQSVDRLTLSYNRSLENLAGLASLQDFNAIHIVGNSALTNLEGLEALETADTSSKIVRIAENQFLTSLAGLPAWSTLLDLDVSHNESLVDLSGLSALVSVRDLEISHNRTLTSLEGLAALREVRGDLWVEENDALAPCEVEALLMQLDADPPGVKVDGNEGECMR